MTGLLPDWGLPLGAGFWQAFGHPGCAIGLPVGLKLEREDGRPGYALHSWRIAGGALMDAFGVLTMRFVGDDQEPARTATIRQQFPDLALSFPGLTGQAYCRFTALDVLDLPGAGAAMPLTTVGQGLILTQRLTGSAVQLLKALTLGGGQPVVAEIVTAFTGRSARVQGTARLDGNALAARMMAQPGGRITRTALLETLRIHAWPDAIVTPQAPDAATCAAIADRLTATALDMAPPDATATEPRWCLRPDALTHRTLTLMLDDDTICPRAVLLRSPALIPPDVTENAISDPLLVMQTGFVVLTLAAVVPEPRVGADVIGVEIEIPAHPPERPQTLRRTVAFDTGSAVATLPLRLAPGEPVGFNYRAFTIAMDGTGSTRRDGPSLHVADTHLTIPAAAWPVDFLLAEATTSLLATGNVALSYQGGHTAAHWQCDTVLSTAQPRIAIARPKSLDPTSRACKLLSLQGGAALPVALPPDTGDLFLDLAQIPEAGPQTASVAAEGAGPLPPFEYLGEDDRPEAARLVRLRPGDPPAELRWLPASPFRAGLRCRWAGTPPGAWSQPLPPGTRITLHAGDAQTVAWPGATPGVNPVPPDTPQLDLRDIELLAEDGGVYRYRPRAPRLQRGADGKPSASLIAFGTSVMVQLTAEWTMDDQRLADLTGQLERRDGKRPTLTPASDTVRETALVLQDGLGAALQVVTGTALGAPPQTSLLAVTLSDDLAERLKRALAGERGLATLRYTIEAADPQYSAAAIAITTLDPQSAAFASASRSTTSSRFHTVIAEADLADLVHTQNF